MLFQILFFWIIFLFFLIPILLSGILILKRFSIVERFELLLPVGSILGLSFFVLSLNFSAFFLKGMSGVIFSYFLLIVLTLFIYLKGSSTKVSYPSGKALYFCIFSVVYFLFSAVHRLFYGYGRGISPYHHLFWVI